MEEHDALVLKRLDALERELAKLKDRVQIENLASRYQYYYTAGEGRRILSELWCQTREDVSFEVGPSGIFTGLHRLSTYYMKHQAPGRLLVHAMTTPDVVIDREHGTAKGLWMTIGSESEAGDLGDGPPAAPANRRLLSSADDQGRSYRAEWVWQKFYADFLLEDGVWRIWHLHLYEIFRCPFDTDWVRYSELRKKTDGLRCDALFTPEIEPDLPPGFPREYMPEFGTSYHWQYSVHAVPLLEPQPPLE